MAAPREEVAVGVRVERRWGVSAGVRWGVREVGWGRERERRGGMSGYAGG